jgi:hypothetical protein
MAPRALTDSAIISPARDVLVSEFGDELVILNLEDGVYYGLDDVGARSWRLLQGSVTVPAIRNALVEEYEVDPDRAEHDIRALLEECASRGLVEIQEPSS